MLGQASSGVYALGETDEPAPITPIPVQARFQAYQAAEAGFRAHQAAETCFGAHQAGTARFVITPVDVEIRVWIGEEEQETDV